MKRSFFLLPLLVAGAWFCAPQFPLPTLSSAAQPLEKGGDGGNGIQHPDASLAFGEKGNGVADEEYGEKGNGVAGNESGEKGNG